MNDMAALPSPMSLFASAWGLFRSHRRLLVGIVVVPSILVSVGQALFLFGGLVPIIIGCVFSIAGAILSVGMQPAAIIAVHRLSTEPEGRHSITDLYEAGMPYFWAVILIVFIQVTVFVGSSILLFVPAIVVCGYASMVLFARILGGKPGLAAFVESYSLVKGRWSKVVGRLLFLGIVYIAVAIVISWITAGAGFILGAVKGSFLAQLFGYIANLAVIAAMGPVSLAYTYRLYESLLSSRTRPDIESRGFKIWLLVLSCLGFLMLAASVVALLFFKHTV